MINKRFASPDTFISTMNRDIFLFEVRKAIYLFLAWWDTIQGSCLAETAKGILLLHESVPGTITYKVPLIWIYDSFLDINYPHQIG